MSHLWLTTSHKEEPLHSTDPFENGCQHAKWAGRWRCWGTPACMAVTGASCACLATFVSRSVCCVHGCSGSREAVASGLLFARVLGVWNALVPVEHGCLGAGRVECVGPRGTRLPGCWACGMCWSPWRTTPGVAYFVLLH